MNDEREKVGEADTSVELPALLRLFRDRANRALDPDDDTRKDHELQNIRDVCDSILEDG